jgi:hypothetical protein
LEGRVAERSVDAPRRGRVPNTDTSPISHNEAFTAAAVVRRLTSKAEDVVDADGGTVDKGTERAITSSRGAPLDPGTRSSMESAFGTDFSAVRVHTGHSTDDLNTQLSAKAFTTGSDVFIRSNDFNPATNAGQRLLAHELTHVVQQTPPTLRRSSDTADGGDAQRRRSAVVSADGAHTAHGAAMTSGPMRPVASTSSPALAANLSLAEGVARQWDPVAVVRRQDDLDPPAEPTFTKISRRDYQDRLIALVPVPDLEKTFATLTDKMKKKLTKDFGVKGMSWYDFRSDEALAWRSSLKAAGRAEAATGVDQALVTRNINLDTERAFYALQAKQETYSSAKGSIARVLEEGVNDILQSNWTNHEGALMREASALAQQAAWGVYKEAITAGKSIDKVESTARKAAKAAGLKVIDDRYKAAQELNTNIKRRVFEKPNAEAGVEAPASMQQLGAKVEQQVRAEDLGGSALDTVIQADSVTSGIGIVAKTLDQAIPTAGDQVALSIEIQIPIMAGPGYVSFTLSGKAARGIDGAMTSGVPVFGDPRRLEVMVDLAFKVGADLIGFDIGAGVNFFVRGGGNDTALCMKAFSYGAYRTIAAVSDNAANWWAGANKAVQGSKTEYAEAWAAMLEEQAFKEGDAFVDIGMGASAGAAAKFEAGGSGFEAGLSGGLAGFWRYDEKALQESLGAAYASPVADKEAAQQRRRDVGGRGGGSWGVSASVGATINGQGVTFAGSVSGPMGAPEWGLELSGTITYSGGPSSTVLERFGAGCATAIAGLVKNLIGLRKAKAGGLMSGAADVTQIVNSGLDNAITNALGDVWSEQGSNASVNMFSSATPDAVAGIGTSSTLQVALLLGWDGEAPIVRLEIRSGRKLEINKSLSGAGVKVSAEKTTRLLAVGYDKGGWDGEAFGVRAKKREGQRETNGLRT